MCKNQSTSLQINLRSVLPLLPRFWWSLLGVGGAPSKRAVGCWVSNTSCKKNG
jgi:hypothetical protein